MVEEITPFLPVIIGLGMFFFVLYFFSSIFIWLWMHPALTAPLVAVCVWLGFLGARRARV